MRHGLIIVNKERGKTSHQVVAGLRRSLNESVIGHTGTLDPEAIGVLVIGLGEGTRSFPYLNEGIKVYRAQIIFGRSTDTYDITGKITAEDPDARIPLENLQKAVSVFTGDLEQLPPMYSAVKVNGKKLYELARRGEEIERRTRPIRVHEWRLLEPHPVYAYLSSLYCEITCSRGTYIRSLIHDLGQFLGCGAVMGELIRLRSGDFSLDRAHTTREIEDMDHRGELRRVLIPLHEALSHLPFLAPDEEDLEKIRHGGKLSFGKYGVEYPPGTVVGVMNHKAEEFQRLMAIVRLEDNGTYRYWQPIRVFQYR